MTLAHLTLPTRDAEATAAFFEDALGWRRIPAPGNAPMRIAWLDIGRGQQLHILSVADFEVSPFEREFGRHVAVFHPSGAFDTLKRRLVERGAEIIPPMRPTPFERFFFREPVNGYVFEVIDQDHFIEE